MIKIGLLGLGTVGSGVYEIINNPKNNLKRLLNKNVEISKILVRDKNKKRNISVPENILTENPDDLLNDPDIDIIVEVMGGIDTAYKYISTAFKNNKHVVTANKAVVSKYLNDFLSLANRHHKGFLFEASVAGGIPIIKPLKQNIRINQISEIKGILNGTTNFILTKMAEENLSFNEALALATELGYAEADPTDDIEGYDVQRKLAILSSIAFHNQVAVDSIQCRGIRTLSTKDIEIFERLHLTVKLAGKAIACDDEISASVEPILIDKNSTMATVKDAFNIVSITGDTIGNLQFYGQGAGKNPTANAVVCDIYDIISGQFKSDHFIQNDEIKCAGIDLFKGKYYIRINTENKQKVLHLLDKNHIHYDIISIHQELILITDLITAKSIDHLINQLQIFENNYFYARIEVNDFNVSNYIAI
ncbi:MAG: homoserine dehydrogenase [Marinisporobacter sp.]|jgi:homoserine dehydrogenase|nr:homoserine dehydrogenase [Marinisporobacter sp.]